jgi:replicative DNA helicase
VNDLPKSQRAEEAMIAAILRDPSLAPEVFNVLPDARAVYYSPYRLVYDRLIESHYADEPMDALWIAEALGQKLSKAWQLPENEVVDRLVALAGASTASGVQAADYARIVKRHSDYRALSLLADRAKAAVLDEDADPAAIAGELSAAATLIATDQTSVRDTLSYRDLGRRWVIRMKEQVMLRRAGVELGAYFDLPFIDDYVKGLRPTELWICGGEPGVGKRFPLDTPLPTPSGWTTIGDVQRGDVVYDEDGRPTRVTGVSPVEKQKTFLLKFSDGSSIEAGPDHVWEVSTKTTRQTRQSQAHRFRTGKRNRPEDPAARLLLTTEQMAKNVRAGWDGRANYGIRVAGAIAGPQRKLPIDPYVLGTWLAEGSKSAPSITLGDNEIVNILRSRGADMSVRESETKSDCYLRGTVGALRTLGLLGAKHIPPLYLRASIDQRKALLAGIADGDGWNDDGTCEITTVIPALRDGLHELISSLGGVCCINEGRARLNGKDYGPKWNVRASMPFNPFWIKRKAEGWHEPRLRERYVVSIDRRPQQKMKCIAVESSSHLYLAGRSMIPTHNSAVSQIAAENFARRQMKVDKKISTLILSLEMGEEPNSTRLAQRVGGIEGDRLREGTISDQELFNTARAWAHDQDMPLHINHASLLRESQMRALVADEVRRNNVGLLIIDHFRMIEPDNPSLSRLDADDQIVKFLKMGLAKDLNLAVVCLAHTVKGIERMDKRPRLSDLRGSGAIAAFADFVSFVFRPWPYATDTERDSDHVKKTDAEMIWAKSRHSSEGTGEFFMNLAQMHVR